ncbi:MAG TPA: Ig-like domain-containing protein [Mycobacteriales bacterium]|nr:Ig-like domain-containing protein [Mycobacteriales bacterium]
MATTVRPSATFDEPVQPATVSISVRDAAGGTVAGATAYDATSRTATVTPAAPLTAGTAFTVAVSARDTAGNAMTPYTWSFRIAAPPPPPGSCPCSI